MRTQIARTATARQRAGPKQRNEQISARKKQASAKRNGKAAIFSREPKTLKRVKKHNKRENAASRKQKNGTDRNHEDATAILQAIPNNAPDMQRKLTDPAIPSGGGARFTYPGILSIQAIAMAHWQLWALAMTACPRAWISASAPWRYGR